MATRPIFIPKTETIGVNEHLLDFHWSSGLSLKQKQRSIQSLHKAAEVFGYGNILEISSKSENKTGIELSAFNLTITTVKYQQKLTVETAFQSSKIFEKAGPFRDLLGLNSLAAKRDIRLKESGNLIGFNFFGIEFPTMPLTFFYDWLYINALMQHKNLIDEITNYEAFSDIEFNPTKSINCQAHAVALFVSLKKNLSDISVIREPKNFLSFTYEHYQKQSRKIAIQKTII